MKPLLLAALVLMSVNASAEGQIASLVNFESAAARPNGSDSQSNITSIFSTSMEYTLPENISFYGGFSFVLGEKFESAVTLGSRFYSSTPAFQLLPGIPMWSFLGGGVSFLEDTVYYPEAGFRIATSDSSRLDVFIKILNSSNDTYDKHVMIGAGLTF
ncbi:MAG: NRDE family protein [Marinomonas hwangdonensis]|nr:NRDE family protein [Marinomonas hwangdonensis]